MRDYFGAFLVLCTMLGCSGSRQPAVSAAGNRSAAGNEGFTPGPRQTAMPNTLLVVKQTEAARAKYPAIDFHFHGRSLKTPEDYGNLVRKDG